MQREKRVWRTTPQRHRQGSPLSFGAKEMQQHSPYYFTELLRSTGQHTTQYRQRVNTFTTSPSTESKTVPLSSFGKPHSSRPPISPQQKRKMKTKNRQKIIKKTSTQTAQKHQFTPTPNNGAKHTTGTEQSRAENSKNTAQSRGKTGGAKQSQNRKTEHITSKKGKERKTWPF